MHSHDIAADSPTRAASGQLPITRRYFITSLATVSAAALMAPLVLSRPDDIVEVNGWILRRSDLA